MNLLVSSVIFLFFALSVCKCQQLHKNDGSENITMISNLDANERRLSLFPKSKIKFTVKPQTQVSRDKEATETRKPLMQKMFPKLKLDGVTSTTDPVLRRPLMKQRTYTVNMRSIDKDVEEKKAHINRRSPTKRFLDKVDDIVEKYFNTTYNKRKIETSKKESFEHTLQSPSEIAYSSQSLQEAKEKFVFLDNIKDRHKAVIDYLSSEENIETTTKQHAKKDIRLKRGSNIIEEENMETTVSGLKYTGRDHRLTYDLYFKNINS